MATTYAAYYNLTHPRSSVESITTNNADSRRVSTSSLKSKAQKAMDLLAPRRPVHEAVTPSDKMASPSVRSLDKEYVVQTLAEEHEMGEPPVRMYDSVLRRPLFSKAKKGNEMTIQQQREARRKAIRQASVHGDASAERAAKN